MLIVSKAGPDTRLVKHLISVRVHLSTARVFWVKEVVETEAGLDALGAILAGLVGKAGKRNLSRKWKGLYFWKS